MKVRSDKGFAIIVQCVFWSLCVGCAVAVLKIFEGKEILKNNFSWVGEVEALLQTLVFVSVVWFANVLVRVSAILQSLPKSPQLLNLHRLRFSRSMFRLKK